MSQFADNVWFEVEHCCNCQMAFAMTASFKKQRLDDHKLFYCPAGHGQHYTGPSAEQKLRAELERASQMRDAAQARALEAERQRTQVSKAHQKMRTRVMNGVCPCCNRTFQNLMHHMKSEHPEFDSPRTLAALRKAFGMSQGDIAREAGVSAPYVSQYEHGRYVPVRAKERLDRWLDRHNAAQPEAQS